MAHRRLPIFRRRLFTALSVLSLLLCVATLALWVRSYWQIDRASHVDDNHRLRRIESVRGRIEFAALGSGGWALGYSYVSSRNPNYHGFVFGRLAASGSQSGTFLGFGYMYLDIGPRMIRAIAIPHWSLALLFTILPALHLRAMIRSRRLHRAGHCRVCGYDLRATPDRCPECGTEVRSQKSEVSNGKTANPLTSDL